MALEVGSRLAHYDVTALIGEGGMGQVYRARDTKLDRDVALKVLPQAFTDDPDRLARFEREAKVLASLNHPNIGHIYGLEEAEGTKALVLELIEGPTLADRIARGPIPIDEALPIAKQIAEALEAAHEAGVIHRDLKPANIKVREDGTVKVLDFGLAKALDPSPGADPSQSPTLTVAATQMGVIMGTAAYMSPEQITGKPVRRASDLWSFGVVLFETLSGEAPFVGGTAPEILTEVLKSDPDWALLPRDTPDSLHRLLRRCLAKDARARIADAGVARLEIEEASERPRVTAGHSTVRATTERPWQFVTGLVVGTLALAVLGWNVLEDASPTAAPTYFEMLLPPDQQLVLAGLNDAVVLSDDGRYLAFVGRGDRGRQLYMKSLDEFVATAIPGTEGASFPFFSPNGQWLGFFAGGEIRKVPVSGGATLKVCDGTGLANGATWGPDNMIVFSSLESGLSIVSADSGVPELLTQPDPRNGEVTHGSPRYLPDGSGVLFTVHRAPEPSVALLSLETREWVTLFEGGAGARWSPTGHLLLGRNGTILAVPFDLTRGVIDGSPVPVLEGVYTSQFSVPYFSVSANGSLLYVPSRRNETMVWADAAGSVSPLSVDPDTYEHPRVSPDGRHVAFDIGPGDRRDIWVFDTVRGVSTPLTVDGGNFLPLWTPDGQRIVFASTRTGSWDLYWMAADGTGQTEPLLQLPYPQVPSSFAPDGTLAYYEINPDTGRDIWVLPPNGKPSPFVVTQDHEAQPTFSPDGHWVAYSSNRSGRAEVYIRPYPGPGADSLVSTDGGSEPLWSQSGDAVYFRNGESVWRVAVSMDPDLVLGTPELVLEGAYDFTAGGDLHYSATPDRQQFLMVTANSVTRMRMILNWFADFDGVAQ